MGWNATAAVQALDKNAHASSTGYCARYVCSAIEAGGLPIRRTSDAKNLGPSLISEGFAEVAASGPYQAGDVVVIDGFGTTTHGHAAMYNGEKWVSDFTQRTLYPGPGYRSAKPKFKVYRHP